MLRKWFSGEKRCPNSFPNFRFLSWEFAAEIESSLLMNKLPPRQGQDGDTGWWLWNADRETHAVVCIWPKSMGFCVASNGLRTACVFMPRLLVKGANISEVGGRVLGTCLQNLCESARWFANSVHAHTILHEFLLHSFYSIAPSFERGK